MRDESRFVTESLEALLVSIADGVRDAQNALNSTPPLDAFGRPMATYHLPYLDFDLHVEMETVTTPNNLSRLWIKPAGASTSSERSVTSTISGRLISVPPGEGLPTPVLTVSSKLEKNLQNKSTYKIIVTASNSSGETLVGQSIELNINVDASIRLSKAEKITLPEKLKGVNLTDVILVTDESGMAETVLTIVINNKNIPAKAFIVLTAELGIATANLTIQAGEKS